MLLRIKYSDLRKILGILIFSELFFMGSGQLLPIYGGLTLRMVNFFFMVIIGWLMLLKERMLPSVIAVLIVYYLVIFFQGIIVGLINGGGDKIILDIKPLSYFFCIPFMYFYFKDLVHINLIANVLKKSALLLSVLYIGYVFFYYLNYYEFYDVYDRMKDFTDFMFRGWSGFFFYKGFIILPIALVFYNIEKGLLSWQSIVVMIAIFYTQTRGFWLLGILSYVFCIFYKLRKNQLRIPFFKVLFFVSILIAVGTYLLLTFNGLEGDRVTGDNIRIETIRQVFQRVSFVSFFIGHGFGIGVPIKEVHMEMSYLEIFHKQGVFGLLFWVVMLFDAVNMIFRLNENRDLVASLVIGIVLIYIQSLFNPYINNSIGMGFVLFAYVALKRLEIIQIKD